MGVSKKNAARIESLTARAEWLEHILAKTKDRSDTDRAAYRHVADAKRELLEALRKSQGPGT